MKDVIHKALLLDSYGPLLTERQRYCMEQHFENDLSLGEIAEELSISRQAVHDTIQRAGQLLEEYEDKLQLVAHEQARQAILAQVRERLAVPLQEDAELNQLLQQL